MSATAKKNSRTSTNIDFQEIAENLIINDESWRCIVTMLVETQDNQLQYTSDINKACENGYRKTICAISRKKMLSSINISAKSNLSYAASPTASLERIRERARAALRVDDEDEDDDEHHHQSEPKLPSFLEAALIKWMIYEARLESLARKAAEVEMAIEQEREFLALQQPGTAGGSGGGGSAPVGTQSKRTTAKSVQFGSARKPNSKLRKRGEEWKDRVYVDDAPNNGPNLYILLTGFRDPGLPLELIKVGVPLNCIFKLENLKLNNESSSEESISNCKDESSTSSLSSTKCLRTVSKSENNSRSSSRSNNGISDKFWSILEAESICRDVAVRKFCPRWHVNSDPNDLYDAISYMLYDVHDTLVAHATYLSSMKVLGVHEPKLPRRQIISGYEAFMDRFVAEAREEYTSLPGILEALLRQVEENLRKEQEEKLKDKNDGDDEREAATPTDAGVTTTTAVTSLSKVNSAAFARLTEKLRLLNLKYELISPTNDSSSSSLSPERLEPELILHGDSLRLNACRANDEAEEAATAMAKEETRGEVSQQQQQQQQPGWKFDELESFGEAVVLVEEPRITEAWCREENRDEVECCREHLPGIFKCCEKEGIDRPRAKHLLNLLGFRQLLDSYTAGDDSLENCTSKTCSCMLRELEKSDKLESIAEETSMEDVRSPDSATKQEQLNFESSITLEQEQEISGNHKDANLSGNISRDTRTKSQTGSRHTNSILDNFNLERKVEVDEVAREQQQRNIIFDELAEVEVVPAKENENISVLSLNFNPKRMRIAKKFVKQKIPSNMRGKCEEENTENYTSSLRAVSSTDCLCPFAKNVESSRRGPKNRSLHRSATRSSEVPLSDTSKSFARVCSLKESIGVTSPSWYETNTTSSTIIGGGSVLRSFEQCSSLFGLINAQESLGLARLDAGHQQQQCLLTLEEFEDAELLAPLVFLQIVRDCFQEYDRAFVANHFLPTDSILLLFYREPGEPNKIIERRVTCSLRTAVCLRDFCEFVADEEREWLEKRFKSTDSKNPILDRCRRKVLGGSGDDIELGYEQLFKDEDFLLPGSLKACDLELLNERNSSVIEDFPKPAAVVVPAAAEANDGKNVAKPKTRKGSLKGKKPNGRVSSSSLKKDATAAAEKDGDSKQRKASAGTAASPQSRESSEPTRTFDFIGYDLGEPRRVQVTNLSRALESCDGLRLKLVSERWLLANDKRKVSTTSVKVASPEGLNKDGWRFWYHKVDDDGEPELFHVLMDNGIIVAFSKLKRCAASSRENELLFEIQMSWPSGLIIKPVEYQDADYPFYILQYYTSKSHGRKSVEDERYRKYLHNGDVVKFLNDGSIIVLRPTGTIIAIVEFGKGDEDEFSRHENIGLSKTASILLPQSSFESVVTSSVYSSTPGPSLRYVVLEADGRRYEVLDGYIVNELDRLRASIAEEYDPAEKFGRRADGTDMLFNSAAELIVSFPDGTRTLTGCKIEPELVVVDDWSAEERELYFEVGEEPEGFVSILAYRRVEHPNYATVICDETSICGVTMADGGPSLRIDPRGLGKVMLQNDRAYVELDKNSVSITQQACNNCSAPTSRTTFHLVDYSSAAATAAGTIPEEPSILLTFSDNVNCLVVRRCDTSFATAKMEPLDDESTKRCECEKSSIGLATLNERRRYRMFAVGRDNEAYEYHHRSERLEYEERMAVEKESSLICRPIDQRPGMEYRLVLGPLPRILGDSLEWLVDYKISKAKPTRKRIGTQEEEDAWAEDEPLKAVATLRRREPRFLMTRLFEGIARPDENSLISMQKALVRYWRQIATGVRKNRDKYEEEAAMMCGCRKDVDRHMRDIALGKVRTIDWGIYEVGRKCLQEVRTQRDEERTRQMIESSYCHNTTRNECPRQDNE